MNSLTDSKIVEDPDGILVRVVQVYLRRRLQAEAPTAILSLYWEEFFRIYAPIVSAVVARHIKGPERDDLVQEVWMTVATKLPEFHWTENRGGLRAWITTLIRNRTIDLIRQKARRQAVASAAPLPEGALEPPAAHGDPTLGLEKEWQGQALRTVLESLREDIGEVNFRIVELHFWGEKTIGDIAGLLDLTGPQVSARLHRVLEKLRRRMGAYFGDS